LNGAFSINGNASVSGCGNKPAVTVQDNQSKSYVENQELNGGPPSGGINGNPDIAVDSDMSYAPLAKTVSQLEKNAIKIQDKWDVLQSNPSNPKTFVLDNGAQLNGNAKGYGIMIVKDGGRINGTFEFNGLVIFEDEDALLANGTADIKGSVIVGSTGENDEEDEEDGDSSIDIDISGNMNIEYDCQTQKYADMAAKKSAQTTYSMLNVYE